LTGTAGIGELLGPTLAGAAAAGGSLLGIGVGPDAESPEQPASATSSVVSTAMQSRFMILSPELSNRVSISAQSGAQAAQPAPLD